MRYVSVFWLRWMVLGGGGGWIGCLGQGLGGWCVDKSVFVVSLEYLC